MTPNTLLHHICAALMVGAFVFSGLVTHGTSEWFASSSGFAATVLLFYAHAVQTHEKSVGSLPYLRYPGLAWLSRTVFSLKLWAAASVAGLTLHWLVQGGIPVEPNRWVLGGALTVVVSWLVASHQRESRELELRRSMLKDFLFAWAKAAPPAVKAERMKWVGSEEWLQGLSSLAVDLSLNEACFSYDILIALDWFRDAPRCAVPHASFRERFELSRSQSAANPRQAPYVSARP